MDRGAPRAARRQKIREPKSDSLAASGLGVPRRRYWRDEAGRRRFGDEGRQRDPEEARRRTRPGTCRSSGSRPGERRRSGRAWGARRRSGPRHGTQQSKKSAVGQRVGRDEATRDVLHVEAGLLCLVEPACEETVHIQLLV